MIKYCITLNSFNNVSLDKTLENVTICGYDGIEIQGGSSRLSWREYLETINSYNLSVIGVTGDWTKRKLTPNNDHTPTLITNDHSKLTYSINYIKNCIEMSNYFGGYFFNICLLSDNLISLDFNHEYISNRQKHKELQKIIPILSELSKFAQEYGINLLIEPLNRYTSSLCVQAKDAINVSSWINRDNLLVMLDTFHMNIEEKDFYDSINISKNFLRHIHLSDSNRLMPGYGHIDFDMFIKSLKNIDYDRNMSFEIILPKKNFLSSLEFGIKYIKTIVSKYGLC